MGTPAPTPSRLKNFFRRTVFILAVLITLGALFIAEEDWRGSRAWRDYKSDMEAKGERFDSARLIPPKVPDDENFAACPYLAHAFTKSPESEGWTNIESYLPKSYSLPHRPGWPYGLSDDLTNWAVAFQGGVASEKMDPAQAAAIILDHLKVCEPVLAELRGASHRSYCRFNIPYEGWANPTKLPLAANVMVEHLAEFKGLFWVLSLRAEAELAAGQSEQALEDVNLMFRLNDGLKDEPLLISQLVCMASTVILLKPIAEGLAEHRWSEAQLRALQERLRQTDLLTSTVKAFYGERDILANPFFSGLVFMPRGWDRLEQRNFNRAFQEGVLPRINLASREINPSFRYVCDLAMSNHLQKGFGAIIHHQILAAMLLPLCAEPQNTATTQTSVDLMTVACALERYRLAEGTYPGKLEALAPGFIVTLPHDIINGQPLKYRRTANGKFILYSIGWNAKDDGGVTVTDKDGRLDRMRGDWVLEYPE
jgi:hypothetical protein